MLDSLLQEDPAFSCADKVARGYYADTAARLIALAFLVPYKPCISSPCNNNSEWGGG